MRVFSDHLVGVGDAIDRCAGLGCMATGLIVYGVCFQTVRFNCRPTGMAMPRAA